MKTILKKALGVVKVDDGVEQNGHSNGFSENGSHKDDGEQEGAMDTQEDGDAIKSPSAPKGRGGRRSKADSEPKSELHGFTAVNCPQYVTTAVSLHCVLDAECLMFLLKALFPTPQNLQPVPGLHATLGNSQPSCQCSLECKSTI